MTDASMVKRVARSFCAFGKNGFCDGVGSKLGCRSGNGVAPSFAVCIATIDQLHLMGAMNAAHDAVAAMRDPTPAMIEAWTNTSPTPYPHGATDEEANRLCATLDWQAMIDAALAEE